MKKLRKVQLLTFEQSFNSLVYILRIIRLYEQQVSINFPYAMFNQLDFDGFDWSLQEITLADDVTFWATVNGALANTG